MAILSLVGKHMKNMVGIAGKMFTYVCSLTSPAKSADPFSSLRTLAEGNINIEMISQGASEIK